MPIRLLVVVVAATAALPSAGSATVCFVEAPRLGSPATYTRAFVLALVHAKAGTDLIDRKKETGENDAAFPGVAMRDMMLAQGEFECSARLVRAYKRSKLEALRLSADATVTASDALAVWTKRYVKRIRKLEDGKIGKGQLSEEMARAAADYNDLLQSYPLGAAALTHALIAAKQVPGKPSLAVTKSQREEILKLLTDYFGDAVKAGSQAGQEYTVGAAAVLYKFVADDRWYSAAE